ncbi:hypothetical protein MHU86_17037 [Fragilaria crotonensis]|nr:hypothetical protein MHU86_17037 [Fragilaria crotonensis]
MLRHDTHSFLMAAALVVSVTSQPSGNCSMCGDGYEVGSPYASASLSCPDAGQGSSDSSCTCKDLEIAGLQGLISECSNVSLVIFATCVIVRKPLRRTHGFQRILPVLFHLPPLPQSPHHIIPVYFAPLPRHQFLHKQELWTLYTVLFVSLIVLIPFICYCLIRRLTNRGARACRRWCVYHASSRYSEGTVTQQHLPTPIYHAEGTQHPLPTIPVSTPTLSIGNPRSRRPLVLEALFPKEGSRQEGDGSPQAGRSNLTYDPQSKQYVFCEDAPDAVSCSICMEFLVPTDDSVTGLCSHSYHRECIMNWLQGDHDDCPNCRQPMWDPEAYEMVDQYINDQEWHSLSAV